MSIESDIEENRKQGRINRRKGKLFENKVRKELEAAGWLVVRFDQNPDVIVNELKKSKPLFIPGRGLMMNSPGFPDFICFYQKDHEVKFIECKINGYLKPEEQKKVLWIKEHLSIPVYVATEKNRVIIYKLQDGT